MATNLFCHHLNTNYWTIESSSSAHPNINTEIKTHSSGIQQNLKSRTHRKPFEWMESHSDTLPKCSTSHLINLAGLRWHLLPLSEPISSVLQPLHWNFFVVTFFSHPYTKWQPQRASINHLIKFFLKSVARFGLETQHERKSDTGSAASNKCRGKILRSSHVNWWHKWMHHFGLYCGQLYSSVVGVLCKTKLVLNH